MITVSHILCHGNQQEKTLLLAKRAERWVEGEVKEGEGGREGREREGGGGG